MGKLSILCLVVAVLAGLFLIVNNYEINRDIVGWKNRAQVSSEPNDMHTWMTKVGAGMERRGMTQGHAALIFKTPDNDMSLIFHTVQQHVDQAKILTSMDRNSPEYQTGLDNLRGSIRELDLHAYSFWIRHGGLVWWIVMMAGAVLAFAFLILWLES